MSSFYLLLLLLLFLFTPALKIMGVKNKIVKYIVSWSGTSPIQWGPKMYLESYQTVMLNRQ